MAFSPVRIEDGSPNWYGLGPLAVAAAYQRWGIGRMLVERGIDQLRRAGAAGCVLVGDPAFYRRLGFEHVPALSYPGVPAENLLGMSLVGSAPRGVVTFHEAFHVGPDPASSGPA